jgi:outer membrane protein assembly factor BamB
VWKLEAGSAVMGTAAFTPDGVVFCSESGNVIAVSFNGEKMWSFPVPGKLYSGPVVAQDRIIVAVTEGETLLVALDFRGGKQWSFLPPKQ